MELDVIESGDSIPGRKEKRYPANALVKIKGSQWTLKDVSLSGGCIQSQDFIEIMPSGTYTILVTPEEESHIGAFEMGILARWVRVKRGGSETGFIMIIPPGSRMVEEYIAYLKSRAPVFSEE